MVYILFIGSLTIGLNSSVIFHNKTKINVKNLIHIINNLYNMHLSLELLLIYLYLKTQ